MRLIDYFVGQQVRLRSPLSAQTAAERINAAASNSIFRFGPFAPFRTGVIGRVWWGHLRLRVRSSLFMYNAKPILAGRLVDAPPGSELRLRYRAPAWCYFYYPFWYLVILGLAIGFSIAGFEPQVTGSEKMTLAAMLVAFFFLPLIVHAIGTRRSEEELAEMFAFLAEHAGAEPDRRY